MTNLVDVVITFHTKDAEIFPWSLKGVQKYVEHNQIHVISSHKNFPFLRNFSVMLHDEDNLFENLTAHSYRGTRWGWYLQQLLKLKAADFVTTPYYLVVDSDTIFLRKREIFTPSGKPYFIRASEYHRPYFRKFSILFGFEADHEYSFIAHNMVFSRKLVKEMISNIKGNASWPKLILQGIDFSKFDPKHKLSFSEFETYGHYLKARHPEEFSMRQLEWTNCRFRPNRYVIWRLENLFDFCSFHNYMLRGPLHPSPTQRILDYFNFERWLLLESSFGRWMRSKVK